MEWRNWIRKFIDIDWASRPYLFFLTFAFLASRLPLVVLGFGSDSDAWRVAFSALDFRQFLVYHPSRFPGYPVPELSYSALIDYGWVGTNCLTILVSYVGVLAFALGLRHKDARNRGILVLTFAFFPLIWKNSVTTIDHTWALTFLILAWYFIIKERNALAGIMLGLAVGSRITSAVLLLPLSYLIWTKGKHTRGLSTFIFTSATVSVLTLSPLLLQYGFGFLSFYHKPVSPFGAGYNAILVAGLIPSFFGVVAFLLSSRRLLGELRSRDEETIFLLFVLLLLLLLFALAPYEPEYLMPAIPFGLLLMNRVCRTKLLVVFCALVLMTSIVAVDVGRDSRQELGIHFEGVMVKDVIERARVLHIAYAVVDANMTGPSVVLLGSHLLTLIYLNRHSSLDGHMLLARDGDLVDVNRNITYVELLPLDRLEDFLSSGYTVYYLQGIEKYTMEVYGYDLRAYGATLLEV